MVAHKIDSISALCSYKDKVNVNSICKRLGIKMSTIQSQVKRRIFERLRIAGFVSLVKSSDLLRRILVKMGLMEDAYIIPSVITPTPVGPLNVESALSPEIIQIPLGNAVNIFNGVDDIDYYIYALKDDKGYPLYVSLKLFNSSENYSFPEPSEVEGNNNVRNPDNKLFELEFIRLHGGKGPPF